MTDADRIAQLQEEVAYLRRELGDVLDASKLDRVRRRLGIEPKQAKILLRLYKNAKRVVPSMQLVELLGDEIQLNTLRVHVSRLRERIGHTAIRTVYGEGYTLTQRGIFVVRQVLEDLEVRRAA